MELNQYLEGYKYVMGARQLSFHHRAAIQYVMNNNSLVIHQGKDMDSFIQELNLINMMYKSYNKPMKIKNVTSFRTIVFLASTKIHPTFLKQYHQTVFICLIENESWKKYINDDCKIVTYPVAKYISKKEDDGLLLYTIYQYIKEWQITNVNIFINSFNYYKSLCDVLQYHAYNTQYMHASNQANMIINRMKCTKQYPSTMNTLRDFIVEIESLSECDKIIDDLFICGFCFYNKDNNIEYIRELL